MVKDLMAVLGLFLILLGFYFIYWPISLIVSGITILSYAMITVYREANTDE